MSAKELRSLERSWTAALAQSAGGWKTVAKIACGVEPGRLLVPAVGEGEEGEEEEDETVVLLNRML